MSARTKQNTHTQPSQKSTENPAEFISQIPEMAEQHVKQCRKFGLELDYSVESIVNLDAAISEWWSEPPVMLEMVVMSFGSYLGEVIRRNLGGEWSYDNECGYVLCAIGGTGIRAHPFTRTTKRFENGEADALVPYLATIQVAVAAQPNEQDGSGFAISEELQAGVDMAFDLAKKWIDEVGQPLFFLYSLAGEVKMSAIYDCATQDDVFQLISRTMKENSQAGWCVQMGAGKMGETDEEFNVLIAHCADRNQQEAFVLFQSLARNDKTRKLEPCGEIDFNGRLPNCFF